MRFAGFTDEVSGDIPRQIRAIQALGRRGIELRLVGKGLHVDEVDEAQFGRIAEVLEAAGIRVVA